MYRKVSNGFWCLVCGKVMALKSVMQRHVIRKHMPQDRYKCNLCSQKYGLESDLQTHYRSSHNVTLTLADIRSHCTASGSAQNV